LEKAYFPEFQKLVSQHRNVKHTFITGSQHPVRHMRSTPQASHMNLNR